MTKYIMGACVAAIVTTAVSSPALAKKLDFELCDGLQAPKAKGDGMRPPAADLFGAVMYGTSQRGLRVKACTDALADPLLQASQPLRRASLLRSRAFVQLTEEAPDAALSDIEAARQLSGPFLDDPMFARTMGVSLDLLQAMVLIQKGNREQARALAMAAGRQRAYSLPVQELVSLILQSTSDVGDRTSPYAGLQTLQPQAANAELAWLVGEGRFTDAAALFAHIDLATNAPLPDKPTGTPFMNAMAASRQVASRSISSLLGAYSYAASGKTEKARMLVTETQSALAAAFSPSTTAQSVSPQFGLDEIKRYVDQWAFLTLARCDIAEGRSSDVAKYLMGKGLPTAAATVDLFNALRAALPESERGRFPPPDDIAKALTENRAKKTLDLTGLEARLPAMEFSADRTAYKLSAKSVIDVLGPSGYRRDGFRSSAASSNGITTVEFLGNTATASAVDEMTVLYAADLARQNGKAGFVIVARRDYQRTMNVTRGYSHTPVSSSPAGYKTELDVRFVDSLPASASEDPNAARMIDAAKAYGELAPVYIRAEPSA